MTFVATLRFKNKTLIEVANHFNSAINGKHCQLLQISKFDFMSKMRQPSPLFIPLYMASPESRNGVWLAIFSFFRYIDSSLSFYTQFLSLSYLQDKEVKEEIGLWRFLLSQCCHEFIYPFSGYISYLKLNPTFMGCFEFSSQNPTCVLGISYLWLS